MDKLGKYRQQLTETQQNVINQIWNTYYKKQEWILEISLCISISKTEEELREILNNLNGRLVFVTYDDPLKRRCGLTLLGALLTNSGIEIEKIIISLLDFYKSQLKASQGEKLEFSYKEVKSELGLIDDYEYLFKLCLGLPSNQYFFRWSGSKQEPSLYPPEKAAEIATTTNTQDYFKKRINDLLNQDLPIEANLQTAQAQRSWRERINSLYNSPNQHPIMKDYNLSVQSTIFMNGSDMTNKLRILHISDLHFRGPRETDPASRYRVLGKEWEKNLNELLAHGPIDIVCFTGDIANWGKDDEYINNEYRDATKFITGLMSQLKLPMDRLFVVPGNHDIDRTISAEDWNFIRSNFREVDPVALSRWIRGISNRPPLGFDDTQRDNLFKRSNSYRNWLKSIGLSHLLPENSPHGRLGFRVKLDMPNYPFNIYVIGLDSAWLCGGNDDSDRILLTTDQINTLGTISDGSPLNGFRLALMHHPLSYLADETSCRPLLADYFDLVLRGHVHRERFETTADPDKRLTVLAAGCLYEGDQGDRWPNTHHIIEVSLDEQGHPLCYDILFRGWSPDNGFWFNDNSLYRNAQNGKLRIDVTSKAIDKHVNPH